MRIGAVQEKGWKSNIVRFPFGVFGHKAGHSRERKAKTFIPTGLYSTHFSRNRQIILRCSKVCLETRFSSKSQNSSHPLLLLSLTRGISSSISTFDARSQCRQILCSPSALAPRSQIGIGGSSAGFLVLWNSTTSNPFAPNFIGFSH
ncbi:hypothetical protein AVEN_152423-1 [Araneus ventricosus]|uniref:Uncharacterized protein n=1 Tax=Araneus ventricosus TaxID=182803 RepID=A0A4Y2G9T8_ARAVE|nr:hypothetical protein AVEN_152423-1 [Araneus ventricosus]